MNTQKITSKQERMPLPTKVAGVLRFRDIRDLDCPQEILMRIDNLQIGNLQIDNRQIDIQGAGDIVTQIDANFLT